MADEELLRKRELLESELKEWSDVMFYAREHQNREKRKQLARIDKKIKARKREQESRDEGGAIKKRRKLNHEIISESWGSSVTEQVQD